jgi:hypothetical protein
MCIGHNVSRIQNFGDFVSVINRMVSTSILKNIGLKHIGDKVKEISFSFDYIFFTHISRKVNTYVDFVSKEGQFLNDG